MPEFYLDQPGYRTTVEVTSRVEKDRLPAVPPPKTKERLVRWKGEVEGECIDDDNDDDDDDDNDDDEARVTQRNECSMSTVPA